ncbi:hypothetical protein M9Y10_012698 [Tritrichomonas musculus]|uniref:Yippee domain-containing protein n=1 Tax=Tritrichomonas musculus TaxID=1915356 RepID=A0ABR2IDC0_9EUKA
MNISCTCCACGNVRVKGEFIRQSLNQTIQLNKANDHQFNNILLMNKLHSIEIQNFKNIKGNLLNKSCSDIMCAQCNTIFHLFTSKGKIYMKKVQNYNNHTVSPHKATSSIQNGQTELSHLNACSAIIPLIPLPQPLVSKDKQMNICQPAQSNLLIKKASSIYDDSNEFYTDTNINDKINENDTDFEIMFSNRYLPFVGSYKNNMSIPHDGFFGSSYCDFQI